MNRSIAQVEYFELCGTISTPAIQEALEHDRVMCVIDDWSERTGIVPAMYRWTSEGSKQWCFDCCGADIAGTKACFYAATRFEARVMAATAIDEWKLG